MVKHYTIGTRQTGYPHVQAPSQVKKQGAQPHAAMWEGSRATAHPATPDPASLLKSTPMPPHVPLLWTPPPCLEGFGAAMCLTAIRQG
jgi:hypothetical protein